MRPRLIDSLNQLFGTSIFDWVIPDPSVVYPLTILVCAIVYVRRLRFTGADARTALYSVLAGSVGAFIGAKLIYVVANLQSYILLPSHLLAPGGTMSWGAYIGAILGVVFYAHRKGEPSLRSLDVLGSCLGLGPFIGRWSCLLNGDDYGKIADVPWAIQYPAGSIAFAAHVNDGLISHNAALSAPVHPNQIYLSLNGLFLFILMSWVWKKYRHHEGLTFGLFCVSYGILRFILEFFRDEPMSSLIPLLNVSQVFSLAAAGAGALLLLHRSRSFSSNGKSAFAIVGENQKPYRGETP
jgi:phosphatidylglycerol:prolipoprotein diacylglycerol transferase